MLGLRVDPNTHVPPSAQLVAAVLDAVASGQLGSGAKLPSVRSAAVEAWVNPNTVSKAWRELEAIGVVLGRNGSGVFVTAEGVAIARARREAETLTAIHAAIRVALRGGLGESVIRGAVEAALGEVEGRAPRGRRPAAGGHGSGRKKRSKR